MIGDYVGEGKRRRLRTKIVIVCSRIGGGGVTRLCHFDRNSRMGGGGVIRGDALARQHAAFFS